MTSTSIYSAPENNLAQRVVSGEVPKPSKMSSFVGRYESLLSANKCCNYVPYVLVCIVFRVSDVEHSSDIYV
ncbi:hypothetical protein DPMN_041779 [Dreissena polymorpha]|uniref:Uncharacterized protein n=1 Tax=Dreissena polymorpha TaxID=45954 RepID=A0A9D4CZB4_DREPO|nr:hypothetical protein DPMN_041779 [Dreissena polymorpha]